MARSFALGGVRWWLPAAADEAAVRRAVGRALDVLEAGAAPNLKRGRRKALYPLALRGAGEPDHLLKVNDYGALVGLRRRLFGSKARRELRLAEAIARRGVATPVPLAAGERRAGGRVRTCYLLVALLPGARDLRRVAADPGVGGAERRALAHAFGAFARQVHDAGVAQDDFQPNNFLLGAGGAGDLFLIDCERVRLRPRLSRRARARMLAKLERELAGARLAERARFLRAYARGDRAEARRWWRGVAREARALAARDAARLTQQSVRPGRRFVRLGSHGADLRTAEADADALRKDLGALLYGDARPFEEAAGEALDDAQALASELRAVDDAFAQARPASGALRGAERHFAFAFDGGDEGAGRRAFARSLVLARRGLAPRPVALLARGSRALLVFEGPLPARLDALDADARRAALPALTVLLARLDGFGALRAPPPARLVGRLAGGLALLDPTLFVPGPGHGLPERRAARALAARILGLESA